MESEFGIGSNFIFTAKIKIAGKEQSKLYKNTFQKLGMKILVVDDDAESREIIENMLTAMSLEVTMSSSGEEAIEILCKEKVENRYNLVIMDWKMPGIDGIEASKRIKNMFASGKAPAIIMLTAYNYEGLQEMAEQIGLLEAVLYKPVTPSLLYNAIIHVCGKEELEQVRIGLEKNEETAYIPELSGIRVLLVEDNEINWEVAKEILQGAGMVVTLAMNGSEAVEKVKVHHYDIVLMDVQMPVMDGYAATMEIRKFKNMEDLPIIAMTANALISDKEKCLQAGMNDYISKPIDTNILLHKIAFWSNMKRMTSPETTAMPPITKVDEGEASSTCDEIISKVIGIDVQTGLERVGGNRNLYCSLLRKFRKNHKEVVKEIRNALYHGDLKAATVLAHTIKGVAGNIGARKVYLDAEELENELKADRQDYVEPLLMQLNQELVQIFDSIALMEKEAEESETIDRCVTEMSLLKPSLYKLEKLLQDNDIEAVQSAETIALYTTNTVFAEKTTRIKDNINQYDFEGALVILNEIIINMEEEEKGGKGF